MRAGQSSYTRYRRRRPSTVAVTTKIAALASAATLVIGGGLAWQMSHGADPALGLKPQPGALASNVQPRTKTIKTTVIPAPAPVVSAPAPAPAPAPVVSGTS